MKDLRSIQHPDRIWSYFRLELGPLALVLVSGILYNVGLTAGPYFEGRLVQCLFDIHDGSAAAADMVRLAGVYLLAILAVQAMRCVKRFYVRRFANDTGRNMRQVLYSDLVRRSKAELEQESMGAVMTKAVADVDACAEGMRKFTTEVFDTGVALAAYVGMLFAYDWRLALIACMFPPAAFFVAGQMRKVVTGRHSAYKKSAGELNDATLDRISNALLYRVHGQEENRDAVYEACLADYEKRAVAANVWESSMQPIYSIIAMIGAVPILYFGGRNVLGTGWTAWDIAAFTTFLACFTKIATKASKAAKLFNSVQKASVSWKRIRPLLKPIPERPEEPTAMEQGGLTVSHLSFAYPGGEDILRDLSFSAAPGDIIGVTGPVASGKSTLGKVFLCESPYQGSVRVGDRELRDLSVYERSRVVTYLGHQPELMNDTVRENVRLGSPVDAEPFLRAVCLDGEVAAMPAGADTEVGAGGVRLSGGQQARLALARTLCHGKELLVLDDPFSAVDRGTEQTILDELRRMAAGKVVLLISHRLDRFPKLDRVIWLDRGEHRVGTHGELLEQVPLYAELYHAQTAGGDGHETA